MKIILFAFSMLFSVKSIAQSTDEKNIVALSNTIFKYEVERKTDLLTNLFDEKLQVVNSHGQVQNKEQYISTLNSSNFRHDSIKIESSVATIQNNTAILIGRGRFVLTISDNKIQTHLAYIEVFVRDKSGDWKLLAISANMLPD